MLCDVDFFFKGVVAIKRLQNTDTVLMHNVFALLADIQINLTAKYNQGYLLPLQEIN